MTSRSDALRVRTFAVLERAVEEGVALGYRRAHKHSERPPEAHILDAVARAVLDAIDEVFAVDDESEGEGKS